MKNLLKEFETFAMRGNVIDLAVGVVIGAAFNQVTTALANGVLTPPIGLLMGGYDFSTLSFRLGGNAVIQYGAFLQALVNFILIAFVLFLIVKGVNTLRRKQKQEEAKPAENPELKVLLDIRDELRKKPS